MAGRERNLIPRADFKAIPRDIAGKIKRNFIPRGEASRDKKFLLFPPAMSRGMTLKSAQGIKFLSRPATYAEVSFTHNYLFVQIVVSRVAGRKLNC